MTVDEALDVLRAAGWDVHTSTGVGQLAGGILVSACGYHPDNKAYQAKVARQPWQAAEDVYGLARKDGYPHGRD